LHTINDLEDSHNNILIHPNRMQITKNAAA